MYTILHTHTHIYIYIYIHIFTFTMEIPMHFLKLTKIPFQIRQKLTWCTMVPHQSRIAWFHPSEALGARPEKHRSESRHRWGEINRLESRPEVRKKCNFLELRGACVNIITEVSENWSRRMCCPYSSYDSGRHLSLKSVQARINVERLSNDMQ